MPYPKRDSTEEATTLSGSRSAVPDMSHTATSGAHTLTTHPNMQPLRVDMPPDKGKARATPIPFTQRAAMLSIIQEHHSTWNGASTTATASGSRCLWEHSQRPLSGANAPTDPMQGAEKLTDCPECHSTWSSATSKSRSPGPQRSQHCDEPRHASASSYSEMSSKPRRATTARSQTSASRTCPHWPDSHPAGPNSGRKPTASGDSPDMGTTRHSPDGLWQEQVNASGRSIDSWWQQKYNFLTSMIQWTKWSAQHSKDSDPQAEEIEHRLHRLHHELASH